MAFNYSPKVVTDGLVLYLDAANPNSYVSGSTTWRDISRSGINGTLVNGPTFSSANGGSIIFDGSNDYAVIPYTPTLDPTVISFNSWVYSLNWVAKTGNQKIFSKTQAGGYAFGTSIFTANNIEFIVYVGGAYRSTIYPLSSLALGWVNFQGTFDGRYMNLYVNGRLVNSYDYGSISTITYNNVTQFIIAAEPGLGTSIEGNYFGGSITSVQIYNRSLSATEVLQNYNATKTRFGLT
jgi:hypothetical protein